MCVYICELLVCGDAPLEGEEGGDGAFLWVLWGRRHTAHLSQHWGCNDTPTHNTIFDPRFDIYNDFLQILKASVLFKGQPVSHLEFDLQGSRALEPRVLVLRLDGADGARLDPHLGLLRRFCRVDHRLVGQRCERNEAQWGEYETAHTLYPDMGCKYYSMLLKTGHKTEHCGVQRKIF